MNLTLTRTKITANGIFGELRDDRGNLCFETLEHNFDGAPALPPGVYKCVRGTHALEDGVPFVTFEITDVPGHTRILLHKGNWNRDSKGCVLLGNVHDVGYTMILQSTAAFARFMAMQAGLDSFSLVVHGLAS